MASGVAAIKDRKQRALDYINARIQEGAIEPGARLDINILAKEIGVSSTPVREAFSALESIGLIEHLPRFGMIVRKMTPEQVAHLYELREGLECFAVEKAAERRTEAHLAEMRRLCDVMRGMIHDFRRHPGDPASEYESASGWAAIDMAFHHTVFEASGNTELVRAANNCRILSQICRLGFRRSQTLHEFREGEFYTWWGHTRVFRAIQHRQPEEARQAMRAHLGGAKDAIVRAVGNREAFKAWPREDASRIRELES